MKPSHAPMSHFQAEASNLLVGGKTLAQIEQLVGRTPFYAYDKSILEETIVLLKQHIPSKIKLHYAIKANPYLPLVNFIKPLVDGFDVASKKEMLLALQTGMDTNEISFAGPGKTEDDIRATIIAGVTLHVESKTEITRAIKLGQELSIKPNIAIRVNPAFELKSSGMKMAGGAKPFGIDEEQVFELLPALDYAAITFRGFHIFAGSQNLNADAIIDMHSKTFELAAKLKQATPVSIDYVNIGGGLGIPYFPGEKWLDITPIMAQLEHLLETYASVLGSTEIIMELGRYIVGKSGIYVSKVVDIKDSRATQYAICDGGLHHHLANSGNFGQVIRKNYPVAVGNKISRDVTSVPVTIVGPLCTPLDIIADKMLLPAISINDYVVVYQSGAYGASASPKDFLSQPSLSEILL